MQLLLSIKKPKQLDRLILSKMLASFKGKMKGDSNMGKAIAVGQKENKKEIESELKTAIHKMIDAISDKGILVRAYTFIKYLK